MPQCAVNGCKNSHRTTSKKDEEKKEPSKRVSYHRFPPDALVKAAWKKACNREFREETARICSRHFPRDLMEIVLKVKGDQFCEIRSIVRGATPSLEVPVAVPCYVQEAKNWPKAERERKAPSVRGVGKLSSAESPPSRPNKAALKVARLRQSLSTSPESSSPVPANTPDSSNRLSLSSWSDEPAESIEHFFGAIELKRVAPAPAIPHAKLLQSMPVMATVDRLLDQPTQVDSVEATEQGAQHHAGDDAEHDGTEAAALVSVGIKEGDTPITFDDRGRISPGKADEGSSGSGTDIEEPAKRPSGINLKRTMAKRSSMDMDAKRGRFVNGNPDVRETHIQNILQNCNTVQSLEGVIKNMKESAQKFDLMLEEKLKEMDNISTAKSLHLEVVERAQFRLTLMKSHVKSKPEVNGQHEQPIAEGRQGPIIPATDVIAKHRRNFPENADPPRKSRRPRQIPVREQASFELANHSTIPLPVINSTFSDKMILFAKEAQTKKLGVTVPVPATSSPAFSYSQNALNFSAHQASPQPESLLATYLTKSTEKAEHMESSLKRLLMDSKGRQSPRVEATDSSASSHFTDILASSKIPAEVTITNVTANHALTVPQRQSALNAKLERQGEDMDGKRLVIENSSTADNCKAAMLGRDAQNCQKCATNAALFECAGCYQARYCSRKCQEDDWERHSEDCMRPKKSVKLAAKTPTSKAP